MTASELSSINQANATRSTGPKTPEGKQRASMNALKHGLTGQRLILQPEEHEAYRELTEALNAELQPKTTMERQLVQKIIDCHTRLNRVAVLDNNMLNFGLLENLPSENDAAEQADDTAIAQAQASSWIAQQMSFEKLGRYEGRLSRQLLAWTKELERLQTIRLEKGRAQSHMLRTRMTSPRPIAAVANQATVSPTTRTTPADPLVAAGKGQDLSPQNSTAHQSHWSLASFGNAPSAAPNASENHPPAPASCPAEEAA